MVPKISVQLINNLLQAVVYLDTAFDHVCMQHKITRVQYLALIYILEAGEGGIALSALGEKMSVSRANITKLADRMEKAGFIIRIPDQKDRRSIKVRLQDKGREVYQQVMPQRVEFAERVLENLTQDELNLANQILGKITVDLQRHMKRLLEEESEVNKSEVNNQKC